MTRKRKQGIIYKDDDETKVKELESFLFGGGSELVAALQQEEVEDSDEGPEQQTSRARVEEAAKEGSDDDVLFFEDRAGDADVLDDEAADLRGARGNAELASSRPPAWHDPADAKLTVSLTARSTLRKLRTHEAQKTVDGETYEEALRRQHQRLHPQTAWAQLPSSKRKNKKLRRKAVDSDDEEEEDDQEEDGGDEEDGDGGDAVLRSAGELLARRPNKLPQGLLESSRLKDANQHGVSQAVVQSCSFHPAGQIMLTAGMDKRIRLFQVDGLRNPQVQSIFLEDMPVHQAKWAQGGAKIVASGRRPHFYVYDLESNKVERVLGPPPPPGGTPQKSLESFAVSPSASEPLVAFHSSQGALSLLSLKTRQLALRLKAPNSNLRTAAFSGDGAQIMAQGHDGFVYTWDVRSQQVMSRFADEGGIGATSLAVSPANDYFATGSVSGVVNVYRRSSLFGAGSSLSPRPLKALMNLTTSVDNLVFNHDSQLLAMSSRMKKDSLRLVHLPSLTVFSNWPTSRSPLQYVHSLAFSPQSGFMAIGNAKGRVLLYRLHHFQQI